MKVKNILNRKGRAVVTITPGRSLQEAVETLVNQGVGSLLVVDGDDARHPVLGILTERDILRASARRFDNLGGMTVQEVMSRDVIIGCEDDSVGYVERVMTESRIRHLPIYAGKELCGIISIGDVVKAMADRAEGKVRHLTDYIVGQYPA